jgi:hypothetical protein
MCTNETTLKPGQLLDLYRYLKLTRFVEERWLISIDKQRSLAASFVLWARKQQR